MVEEVLRLYAVVSSQDEQERWTKMHFAIVTQFLPCLISLVLTIGQNAQPRDTEREPWRSADQTLHFLVSILRNLPHCNKNIRVRFIFRVVLFSLLTVAQNGALADEMLKKWDEDGVGYIRPMIATLLVLYSN